MQYLLQHCRSEVSFCCQNSSELNIPDYLNVTFFVMCQMVTWSSVLTFIKLCAVPPMFRACVVLHWEVLWLLLVWRTLFCLRVEHSMWKLLAESVYQEPFLTMGNNVIYCQLKTSEMLKFHCVHSFPLSHKNLFALNAVFGRELKGKINFHQMFLCPEQREHHMGSLAKYDKAVLLSLWWGASIPTVDGLYV